MRELKAYQENPQHGPMTVVMRFDGHIIFLKSSDTPQKAQMVAQLKSGGASIEEGSADWLKIDMFAQTTLGKFGDVEIDIEEMDKETTEKLLSGFYDKKYTEAHFAVTVKEL